MSNTILKIENLSKQYRLGVIGTGALSRDLNRWWHKIRGKKNPYLKLAEVNDRTTVGDSEYVWALKDINFDIARGEVVGIIGKNGAGKSTLLKLLSRVTGPTTGSIKSRGKIASLLEVGTGFHPELTGRENIYLNGAILGMSKDGTTSKIDEIVAFSGCERYIDTPVKRYSSGMRVRLAFAVAAHLEPDIFIVDEVLAVGDAEFQKKAIGKMQDISTSEGRTVLFVSHNMAAVKSLCTRSIVLENGTVAFDGETSEALQYYMDHDARQNALINLDKRKGNREVQIESITLKGENAEGFLQTGGHFHIEFELKNPNRYQHSDIEFDFRIDDYFGQRISWFSTKLKESKSKTDIANRFIFNLDKLNLNEGSYFITWKLHVNNQVADWVQNGFSFEVNQGYFYSKNIFVSPTQGKILADFDLELR